MFDPIDFIQVSDNGVLFPNGAVLSAEVLAELLYHPSAKNDLFQSPLEDYIKLINPAGSSDYYLDGTIRILEISPVTDLIRSRYCRILSFGWAQSGPNYFTRRTSALSYLFLYTLSGAGILQYGDESYELHAGDGFLIDCKFPHFYQTLGRQWEHVDIHMEGPMLDPLYAEYSHNRKPLFHESINGSLIEDLERIAALQSHRTPYRDYLMAGLLYNLFTRLLAASALQSTGSRAIDESLQLLIRYIDSHYAEKLSLDFLSRFSGISKYYLSREFHRYTGFSPIEYLIHLRIERAEMMLTQTTAPIAWIAEQIGIPNVQHFSKLFRRVTGVSPREYRASV